MDAPRFPPSVLLGSPILETEWRKNLTETVRVRGCPPPTALRADALIKWRVDSAFDFVRPRVDTEKHPPSLTAAVSHPKLDYWFKEIGSRVVVVEDFPFSFYLPLRNIVSRHLGIDAIPLRMRPFSQHQIVVHLQKGADIIRDYTGTELGVVM